MTFPLLTHREIDFVKKEEELKKSLDEKDKWYKEQLETLQRRVRAPPRAGGRTGGGRGGNKRHAYAAQPSGRRR